MGQIPEFLHGKPFNEYMSKKDECIGNLGDSYYDKLIGGVECNPIELSKAVIIKYLLSKYDPVLSEGLDCIYNQKPFTGVTDLDYNSESKLNDNTHLQIFTSYLNAICASQDPITKIIIKTIPMGIEPFSLANSDGTVEFSIDGGITYDNNVEVTGGETVYIKAAQADCGAVCGASAYEIYLTTVPEGETPLTEVQWLASLQGAAGEQGPAGENANIAGLTWKGNWTASPTPAYAVNDAVQYSGTSYVKIGTGGSTTSPPNDPVNLGTSWEVLALAGMTGPAGADGINGASGVNAIRPITTTSYTMLSAGPIAGQVVSGAQTGTDKGVLVTMNNVSASTFTIPAGLGLTHYPLNYQTSVMQLGAGQVQIVAGSGVTIRSANSMTYLRTQYSGCTIIRVTENEYYMFGDLTNVVAPTT